MISIKATRMRPTSGFPSIKKLRDLPRLTPKKMTVAKTKEISLNSGFSVPIIVRIPPKSMTAPIPLISLIKLTSLFKLF